MSSNTVFAFVLGAALAAAAPLVVPRAPQQQPPAAGQQQPPPGQPSPEDMKKMFEQAKKFTEPSEAHRKLAEHLGKWDVEWKMTMGPGPGTAVGKCKAEVSWLIEGRFTKMEMTGTFMQQPFKSFGISGYDNFKQAYVRAGVDSMNTFMLTAQGKVTQDGRTLIWYGTMDEYLTGENDKMVKYVDRSIDADHFVEEVHDLAIGEENTKVVELSFTRAK
jgi:hypothetical protein